MRVAIMQPTYLPWCGYFGLIQSVDLFVLLDSVQFSRRSWQQRNQIKTPNGAQWVSVPVISKGKRDQLICDVEIDASASFANAHRRSIELSYSNTQFFEKYADTLLPLMDYPSPKLADFTISFIEKLKGLIDISTPLIRSSELHGSGVKADLLASLCKEVGATSYVSPPGSKEYLDASNAFKNIGLPVNYFEFKHPEYPQMYGEFLPYMSIIDMLFNCGEQSSTLIRDASEILK